MIKIATTIITCDERQALLKETLASLRKSDWPFEPIVQHDETTHKDKRLRQSANSKTAIMRALDQHPDWILFLEDDIVFNPHLHHNLTQWAPFRRGEFQLASFYNPNVGWWEWNKNEHWLRVNPDTIYGSQAMLLRPDLARWAVDHWEGVIGMQDIKLKSYAKWGKHPIYYHCPSLVQHVGKSTWKGGGGVATHKATDFNGSFRAITDHGPPFPFPFDVDGWLSPKEGDALRRWSEGKRVLEIGAYCGKSTICLAQVAQVVHTIDPFTGIGTPMPENKYPNGTFDHFVESIARYGATDRIVVHVGTAEEIVPQKLKREDVPKFDFVFIDGPHDFASVSSNIDVALMVLRDEALLAFHDYKTHPGVKQAIDARGNWKVLEQADNAVLVRRSTQ